MARYNKILIYIILISVLFYNLLIDILGIPSAIRYVNDIIILFLLFNCLKEGRRNFKQTEYLKAFKANIHQNGWLETVRGGYQ